MVSSVLLKPVWFQALVCRGFRRHGFHAVPQRGSSKLWFAEVSGGMAFMQSRKGGVPSFGLPRFPAAYCTVTIMSFFVLLSTAPIDIVMVLSFSAVGASS